MVVHEHFRDKRLAREFDKKLDKMTPEEFKAFRIEAKAESERLRILAEKSEEFYRSRGE